MIALGEMMKTMLQKIFLISLVLNIPFISLCSEIAIASDDETVSLQSLDGYEFELLVRQTQQSKTLEYLIEEVGTDKPIPLPNVTGKTLEIIVNLLIILDQKIPKDKDIYIPRAFQPHVNEALKNATNKEVIDVFAAANFLDIPYILNGLAAVIAQRIPDDILEKSEKLLLEYSYPELKKEPEIEVKEEKSYAQSIEEFIIMAYEGIKKQVIEEETEEEIEEVVEIDDLTKAGLGDLLQASVVSKDIVPYVLKHIVFRRRSGVDEEYSIADYIKEYGEPSTFAGTQLSLTPREFGETRPKLTSLFGIKEILNPETVIRLSFLNNCLVDFSLDVQGVEKPFEKFINVKSLDLNRNRLRSLPVGIFSGLSKLELLDLRSNILGSSLTPGVFAGLTKLRIIRLNNNQLSRLTPKVFAGLNLQTINLKENPLSDSQRAEFRKWEEGDTTRKLIL